MSLMTAVTTVLHRDFRIICRISHFPMYKLLVFRVFFGLDGVAAASFIGLYDRGIGLCGNALTQEWLHHSCFPTLVC